jgi:hypothetical protein
VKRDTIAGVPLHPGHIHSQTSSCIAAGWQIQAAAGLVMATAASYLRQLQRFSYHVRKAAIPWRQQVLYTSPVSAETRGRRYRQRLHQPHWVGSLNMSHQHACSGNSGGSAAAWSAGQAQAQQPPAAPDGLQCGRAARVQ